MHQALMRILKGNESVYALSLNSRPEHNEIKASRGIYPRLLFYL